MCGSVRSSSGRCGLAERQGMLTTIKQRHRQELSRGRPRSCDIWDRRCWHDNSSIHYHHWFVFPYQLFRVNSNLIPVLTRSCAHPRSCILEELREHRGYGWSKSRRSSWRLSCRYDRLALVRCSFQPDDTDTRRPNISSHPSRSFIGQAPLIGIAMTLCWVFFPPSTPTDPKHTQIKEEEDDSVANSNFSRIDFLGALLMAAAILLFLFPIELGGVKLAWTDRRIFLLLAFSAVTGVLFLLTEAYWAKEPIFPLQLLRQKDAVLSFLIQGLQTAAQLGVSNPFVSYLYI